MLAAGKGYYNGEQIVMDEDERKYLASGDEVIITILNRNSIPQMESRAERRKRIIESGAFVSPTGKK